MINNLFSESEIEAIKNHLHIECDKQLLGVLNQTPYSDLVGVYDSAPEIPEEMETPEHDINSDDVE